MKLSIQIICIVCRKAYAAKGPRNLLHATSAQSRSIGASNIEPLSLRSFMVFSLLKLPGTVYLASLRLITCEQKDAISDCELAQNQSLYCSNRASISL